MVRFEYMAVPAPARGTKAKGVKSNEDRFALSLTNALNEYAGDGWEFVRVETLPVETRKGLTGTQITDHSVLVFRRIKQAAVVHNAAPDGPLPTLTLAPEPAPPPRPERADPPISRRPDSAEPTA